MPRRTPHRHTRPPAHHGPGSPAPPSGTPSWRPGRIGWHFRPRPWLHRHDDPILRPATGKEKGPAAGKIMEAVKTTVRDATPACHGISQQCPNTRTNSRDHLAEGYWGLVGAIDA